MGEQTKALAKLSQTYLLELLTSLKEKNEVTDRISFSHYRSELVKGTRSTQEMKSIDEFLECENPVAVLDILVQLVKEFSLCYNVMRNITDPQIFEVAVMAMTNFGHLTFDDCILMLERVKRGQYVQIRERIDLQVMTEIFYAYDEDEYPKKTMII